jgi:hypothetical protein
MPIDAMSMIVDGFVTLNDRQALEDMREHRLRLREKLLQSRSRVFDPDKLVQLYESEVTMIEMGIAKLGETAV